LLKRGLPSSPEQQEEVSLLNQDEALGIMEVRRELVRVALAEWLKQYYI
jgi:hypothetical protein